MSDSDKAKLEKLRLDIAAIGQLRPVSVLVVDDDEAACLLMRDLMAKYRLAVDEAHSGDKAIAAISGKSYDVVLLDVKMTGMDGLEVYRAIKKSWPNLRVVFCTGHLEWPGLAAALEEGCVQIISKQNLEKSLAEIFEPLCQKTNTPKAI